MILLRQKESLSQSPALVASGVREGERERKLSCERQRVSLAAFHPTFLPPSLSPSPPLDLQTRSEPQGECTHKACRLRNTHTRTPHFHLHPHLSHLTGESLRYERERRNAPFNHSCQAAAAAAASAVAWSSLRSSQETSRSRHKGLVAMEIKVQQTKS